MEIRSALGLRPEKPTQRSSKTSPEQKSPKTNTTQKTPSLDTYDSVFWNPPDHRPKRFDSG